MSHIIYKPRHTQPLSAEEKLKKILECKMESESQENVKGLKRVMGWVKGCSEKIVNVVTGVAKDAKKLAEEDPRRIVHSLKVGLAITLVSLFYYFDFLYEGFGVNAMWAVMTVVVVFEFSVGKFILVRSFVVFLNIAERKHLNHDNCCVIFQEQLLEKG